MKKVSEFLKELDSHFIYVEPQLSEEFEKETGEKAPWQKHTVGSTNTSLGQFKGVEKEIKGNESDHCSYGWEIAAACEKEFAQTYTYAHFNGRGFAFRAAIEAIEKVGK